MFADYRSEYVGQAAALVLAGKGQERKEPLTIIYSSNYSLVLDSPQRAEKIAKVVDIQYGEPSGPPLLTTQDAVAKSSFFEVPQSSMSSGDAKSKDCVMF